MEIVLILLLLLPLGGFVINAVLGRFLPRRAVEAVACAAVLGATVCAAVALVLGGVFIYQGIAKDRMIQTAMREEKVTYLLPPEEVAKGEIIRVSAI